MPRVDRSQVILNVSDWVEPAKPVQVGPQPVVRPPQPPPVRCATCGAEHEWVWDDDLPLPGDMVVSYKPDPGWHEIDSEWYGEKFHCSRRCYIEGDEYKAGRPATGTGSH